MVNWSRAFFYHKYNLIGRVFDGLQTLFSFYLFIQCRWFVSDQRKQIEWTYVKFVVNHLHTVQKTVDETVGIAQVANAICSVFGYGWVFQKTLFNMRHQSIQVFFDIKACGVSVVVRQRKFHLKKLVRIVGVATKGLYYIGFVQRNEEYDIVEFSVETYKSENLHNFIPIEPVNVVDDDDELFGNHPNDIIDPFLFVLKLDASEFHQKWHIFVVDGPD